MEEDSEINDVVHSMYVHEVRVTEKRLEELRSETKKDDILSEVLKNYHESGLILNTEKMKIQN